MNKIPTNGRNPLKPLITRANEALAPQNRFSATPTSRNGNGFHRTDKPTNGDGQWILIPGAKLPPRAFEVHDMYQCGVGRDDARHEFLDRLAEDDAVVVALLEADGVVAEQVDRGDDLHSSVVAR